MSALLCAQRSRTVMRPVMHQLLPQQQACIRACGVRSCCLRMRLGMGLRILRASGLPASAPVSCSVLEALEAARHSAAAAAAHRQLLAQTLSHVNSLPALSLGPARSHAGDEREGLPAAFASTGDRQSAGAGAHGAAGTGSRRRLGGWQAQPCLMGIGRSKPANRPASGRSA